MRMEAHVHGTVLLRAGTTASQIEEALRPWLEYIDEDNLADAKSVHPDEPGVVFDKRRRVLEVCWTGDVGRSFHQIVSGALASLNPFSEEAAAFEVSYYLEDGQDEFSMVFVGPTPETIYEAQRRRMIEDVQNLLVAPVHRTRSRAGLGVDQPACSNATGKAARPRRRPAAALPKSCRCRREESICIEKSVTVVKTRRALRRVSVKANVCVANVTPELQFHRMRL